MFCPRCGNKMSEENARFCNRCGQDLNGEVNAELVSDIAEVGTIRNIDYSLLDLSGLLSLSWDILKKYAGFLFLFYLTVIIANFIPILNLFTSLIINIVIYPFSINIIRRYERDEKLQISDIFCKISLYFKILGLMILNIILILLLFGIILLIFALSMMLVLGIDLQTISNISPYMWTNDVTLLSGAIIFGIISIFVFSIVTAASSFSYYRLAEVGYGIIDSVIFAYMATFRNIWTIIKYFLGAGLLAMFTVILTIGLGLIVVAPMATIFITVLYMKISRLSQEYAG